MRYDKTPLASKKFLAFLLAEATWKAVVLVALIMGIRAGKVDLVLGGIILAVTVVAGFVEAGYILGQASLDRYIRIAEIAAKSGRSFTAKDITIGTPTPAKPTQTQS